ncbi:MAG: hypothetical protein K2P12_01495 [Clostridia bacterium]|nr:hypothetical protein [Clostridia bacterium]
MQDLLYSEIKKYADSKPVRFHMPSHNGEDIGITTDMDITELSFSDNLIESNSVIANTEKNIAKAYKTKYALMLTNGATSGVAIALHTALNYGKKLLVIGKCHKSVYNYLSLFDFEITFADCLDNVSANDYDIIIITTPDYFGMTTDIFCLKDTTALVILDSSHGSHFPFSSKLPDLQTEIADIVILSFHKTLPVLTGGAGIICNNEEIYNHLCYSRSILHSSSPSYLIMASIDRAICNLNNNGEKVYNDCIIAINDFKCKLNDNYKVIKTDDPTRLCISAKGFDAQEISTQLEAQNIYVEMTYNDLLIAIVTPYNYKHLVLLADCLNKIKPTIKTNEIKPFKLSKIDTNCKKIEFVDIENSINRVSAGNIGIYPPATPMININNLISKEVATFLATTKYEVFGLINGKIPVFKNE